MKILLASGNAHKKEELNKILSGHTLILPKDLGIKMDVDETGNTYLDNALLKAEALYELSGGMPVLSDDSGISVEFLDGKPGIHSARYGTDELGRELTDEEKYIYLLKNMEKATNRKAAFICCMVLILDKNRIFSVQESFEGEVTLEAYGKGGFGYDPVFYVPEFKKTAAELTDEEKNKVSHRGKAGATLNKLLEMYD
ncbi:MAG: RdgB/HAM1 family non-canonical purine NTP pyrophosphatase [Spirochaetaceae bacterium]